MTDSTLATRCWGSTSLRWVTTEVRKTITPTAEGYAERVEVDAGARFFEYSALMMSRVVVQNSH